MKKSILSLAVTSSQATTCFTPEKVSYGLNSGDLESDKQLLDDTQLITPTLTNYHRLSSVNWCTSFSERTATNGIITKV